MNEKYSVEEIPQQRRGWAMNNGLFFEGHVEERAGRTSVFDQEGQVIKRISATRVKWLAKAVRHY